MKIRLLLFLNLCFTSLLLLLLLLFVLLILLVVVDVVVALVVVVIVGLVAIVFLPAVAFAREMNTGSLSIPQIMLTSSRRSITWLYLSWYLETN